MSVRFRSRSRLPWRRFYVVNLRRLVSTAVIFFLAIVALVLLIMNLSQAPGIYQADQIPGEYLSTYFEVEKNMNVPWHYLAAVDKAERIPPKEITMERSSAIALHLTGITNEKQLPDLLADYRSDRGFLNRVKREVKAFSQVRLIYEGKVFPFAANATYVYEDWYGASRSYGGDRLHEGIDLMADTGVPILSVCSGVIEKAGWNELGGYRIGIRGEDNVYYYYAHMSRYEGTPKAGDKIAKGQLIGYVGDTGYGPEGTTGQFEPHLHFAMYLGKGEDLRAFNPYPFLKAWER